MYSVLKVLNLEYSAGINVKLSIMAHKFVNGIKFGLYSVGIGLALWNWWVEFRQYIGY